MDIDKKNYHSNDLTQKEYDEARSEFGVFLMDDKYENKIRACFNKYYPGLTAHQKTRLLCKIYAAHTYASKYKENIKEEILNFLPLHLCNLKYLSGKCCFMFEPNNAATYNSCVYLMKKFSSFSPSKDKRKNYLRLLLISILRSLSSCLALFELGDDIHAFSVLRGFIEQEIKLCIILKDKNAYDDFILFNEYSHNLKKGIISEDMQKLFDIAHVDSRGEKEAFLLYGWSSSEFKIMSFRRLLDMYSPEDAPKIYSLYTLASEFVHEDVLNAHYDYIEMRKTYSDYLAIIFFKFLYPLIESLFKHDFLTIEGKKVKEMVNLDQIKNDLKEFIPKINISNTLEK